MPSHVLDYQWSSGNNQTSAQVSKSADAEINAEVAVAGASTDLQVVLPIVIASLVSLYMVCDRALTVQTNDGSSPDDTISLAAGVPLVWHSTCGLDNPLGSDVTDLYLTLAAGADATFTIKTLQDVTP